MSAHVFVIGAGAWGTALGQAAAAAGNAVTIVGRDAEGVAGINRDHRLKRYLGDIALDPSIRAQTDLTGLDDANLILLAVPAQASRAMLGAIGPGVLDRKPVVLCAKGLERETNLRQSEVLAQCAPRAEPFVLSGPSFAHDVARGRPTAITLAGSKASRAESIATALASGSFRPYASGDVVGVETCGALKNVYALGAGAIEGAGLGLSARSAFLARAFAELGRLVAAVGGREATLGGLAGIGDLALSCTSGQSRNFSFGMALGRGETRDQIAASGVGLAEGVLTAPVALALARAHKVDAPLIEAVNMLVSGRARIDSIVPMLMARPLKREE
ncbi:NAD(P)H-dependent glycerol-3-phosphate dehydrogenase [Pelagibacterium montanilacus]|uniref:NAD(P)H-dependent glycerol-3-phosphate dehydrogenase n=1 Tax=Pelagibacterium montanilacus TaxID=2185280 RepID=UPI000F8F731A|nr:NAD(P)H-dependent glycerol-3-phosphate dehydrogenase [Pelagibacterium montanilacus]